MPRVSRKLPSPLQAGRLLLPLVVGLLVVTPVALAQLGPQSLELNFSNPGARSMGFAGAFAALADDATAAFANPAGLVQLTEPEISVEMRQWSYSTPFTEGGRLTGSPTGLLLDTASGLRTGSSSETVSGPSFVSFVWPRADWSLALYMHQAVNFEARTETQGFFRVDPGLPLGTFREDDFRVETDFEIVSYGLSGAYRLSDELSLGLSVVYSAGEMNSRRDLYLPLAVTLPEGPLGRNSYAPEAREISVVLETDDSDVTFSAGLLWHIDPQWSLGVVYRDGSELDILLENITGPAETELPIGTRRTSLVVPTRFPSVLGVGVAFRSRDGRLTVGFEWDRVEYSSLIEAFDRVTGDSEFDVDDGDELRVGGEYAFLGTAPAIALRAGIWLDPDHQVGFTGDDELERAQFATEGDAVHYTGGIGFVFRGFQLDLGLDFSEFVDTASISAIYSFSLGLDSTAGSRVAAA